MKRIACTMTVLSFHYQSTWTTLHKKTFYRILTRHSRKKIENELYHAVSQLKNIPQLQCFQPKNNEVNKAA